MSQAAAAPVLLVEDDPLLLQTTADLLTDSGCDVLRACSAAEAMSLLEAGPVPPVVVTDVNLADGSSGLDLAKTIAERWPQTRVLIVSGACRPPKGDYPEGALFFTKPYATGALVAMVKGENW
ncbi:MAG TPA: response regulator [Allosphingosinicella sp.]|jgi:DNA-binding NtrC family response regulator